jgi:hypothetical protein
MLSEFIFFVLSVYEGWFLQTDIGTKPECDSPKGLRNSSLVEAEVDGNGADRKVFPWRGRVLTQAGLGNPIGSNKSRNIVVGYQPKTEKY